jgi:hypothetical protein
LQFRVDAQVYIQPRLQHFENSRPV